MPAVALWVALIMVGLTGMIGGSEPPATPYEAADTQIALGGGSGASALYEIEGTIESGTVGTASQSSTSYSVENSASEAAQESAVESGLWMKY